MLEESVPPVLRKCVRCERELHSDKFNKGSGPQGLHSYCRECQREYARMHVRVRRVVVRDDIACGHCGVTFTPRSKKHMYCNANCKQKALHLKRHPRAGRKCKTCGSSIEHMRTDAKWCSALCSRKGRPHHREIVRKSRLKTTYGLTPEDFDIMLNAQGGVCAICHTERVMGYGMRLAIDHCHETGKVRGILCGNCNRGIGAFKDDPRRLEDAARYLRGR